MFLFMTRGLVNFSYSPPNVHNNVNQCVYSFQSRTNVWAYFYASPSIFLHYKSTFGTRKRKA